VKYFVLLSDMIFKVFQTDYSNPTEEFVDELFENY